MKDKSLKKLREEYFNAIFEKFDKDPTISLVHFLSYCQEKLEKMRKETLKDIKLFEKFLEKNEKNNNRS